jgi:integral membrane protein
VSRTATAYRVVAWVVGVNLILVMIGFIGQLSTDDLSWFNRNDGLISAIDVAHGWMFMVLIVLIVVLGRRHRWTTPFLVTTALFATIPFVSFWAERRASRALRAEDGLPA